ncbi:hypothetical protein RF11_05461 [Thelohanellus kitauei]|uniref:Tc1-like transposase DDE domain-containing protein n=1 Tax=Thelohanellus kitauei TaxID=669202 RepID=A0A0C2N2W5_THEKT|nr:hypothetical protein RF11_05461 [Thelohanellus kitauei]
MYDYLIVFYETPLHMSDDTIYIDETGFNLHLRRKFGRAPGHERVSLFVTSSREHNICVCAAMHRGGLIHFRERVGAYNADEFIIFLSQMFERTGTGRKNS